ncbi:hypothetical protein EV401DRAFT_1809743, partial [Pisolithus croceorrhizus]
GGPEPTEKQCWFAVVIVDQREAHIPPTDASTSQSNFIGTTPAAPYIDEMLLQIMMDESEVIFKENSAYEVARDVIRLWGDMCSGRDTLLKESESRVGRYVLPAEGHARSGDSWKDSSDDKGDDSDVHMEGEVGNHEAVPQLLDGFAR